MPFRWLIDRLKEETAVESTNLISADILEIVRKDGMPLTVCMSRLDNYQFSDIKRITTDFDVDFVLYTNKEAIIDGSVFDYMEQNKKVIGTYGDLFKVIKQDSNFPYVPKEVLFIVRGLEQHTKVNSIRRVDNKKYEIRRNGLKTLTVIALYDYDLGTESIRNALEKHKTFHAILKANPNGRISTEATSLADSLGIKVLWWRELLGKLNNEWS